MEITEIIGDVFGKNCIIIDDMIDTGGSIVSGAQALIARGAASVFEAIPTCKALTLNNDVFFHMSWSYQGMNELCGSWYKCKHMLNGANVEVAHLEHSCHDGGGTNTRHNEFCAAAQACMTAANALVTAGFHLREDECRISHS